MPELKKEQASAVFHDQGNILVSASAGSGKTFVMIERLIRLITQGKASVKEILAVTFTELAATEMKEKLKDALSKQIAQTGDKRLMQELAEVSTADICTIHAFCGRLIRKYFYAVGLTPDFKILDEGEAGALKIDSVNKAFKELYEKGESFFKTLINRHSEDRSDNALKQIVMRAYNACCANADNEIYFKNALNNYTEQGFNALLNEFKLDLNKKLDRISDMLNGARYSFEKESVEKVVAFIDELNSDIKKVIDQTDIYAFKQFEGYKKDLPRGLRLKGELKDCYELVVGARDEFKELLGLVLSGLNDKQGDIAELEGQREHIQCLYKLTARYGELYALAKREENALDFNDLERFAHQILLDQEIKNAVSEKYKFIFIDEYQDTNDAQEQIISSIANDNLFMVGDAKQSIYGFRGCRPEIFMNKLNGMQERGQKVVLLNHNFRSSDAVIDLVNKVFSFSMTKEYFGMDYNATSTLCSGGLYGQENKGRVALHLIKGAKRSAKEKEQPRIYNLLKEMNSPSHSAEAPTASLIADIIYRELNKDFYDTKTKTVRSVTFGDIAVLTRNRDNKYVRDIVKGLIGYGIPVVSVVKENVCNYPEIQVMINVLKLVDCFSQDVPLAVTLKSPVGGFTDEELAQIVLRFNDDKGEGGFYNAFMHYLQVADTPLKERLCAFYKYFSELRLVADFVGAHGSLKRIVQDNDIEQNLYAERGGRLKVKRLRRFISASKAGDKTLSVKEFLDRIELYPSAFELSEGAEENAVKVMTIHASKGLEFPVVIACGLERKSSAKSESEDVMLDQDLGFAVKSYNDKERTVKETPVRAIYRSRMRDQRLKEELRLFYVALTRASYSLHLTFSGSADKRKKIFCGASRFLDYIPKDIEMIEHDLDSLSVSTRAVGVKKVLVGSPDIADVENMRKNFSFSYPFVADTLLPLKNNVTKAVKEGQEQEHLVRVLFEEDAPDIERGNIAHKILEYYDFNSGLGLKAQVDKLVLREILTAEQVDKLNMQRLEKALSCEVFSLIKNAKIYREKEFIVSIEANRVFDTDSKEQVLLQGVVDLLGVTEQGGIIIDYKYSSLAIDSLKTRYKKQLDLYAYSLEKATGIKVKTTALVNLFTGETAIFD